MLEFKAEVSKDGRMRLPPELRKAFHGKVALYADGDAVVLVSAGTRRWIVCDWNDGTKRITLKRVT